MLIALVLANALIDETPLLRAEFDLSTAHVVEPIDPAAVRRNRYSAQEPELYAAPAARGIQVRVLWRRVRVRMPIPSI